MKHDWQGILWPSLGYPQGVDVCGEAEATLTVIVVGDNSGDAPQAEQVSAQLHSAVEIKGEPVHLRCTAVERTSLDQLHHLGRWSPFVTQKAQTVWRLDFQVPRMPLPETRRTVLCDLELHIGQAHDFRPGAVFLHRPNPNATAILLATDIHVARRWEWIAENVQRVFSAHGRHHSHETLAHETLAYDALAYDALALDALAAFDPAEAWSRECFLHSFVNPNRNFAFFIRMANHLAERGMIDCVWLTGDLVDYRYSRPKAELGDDFEQTEWHFFKELILGKMALSERLRVPTYMLTGNHDHRLYPYHLQTYGLRHCGIADEVTWEYLRRVGAWRRLKYRVSDLDAVRIDRGENHSLNEYHREFNPFTDYTVNFGDFRVVALDTSHDFFCDFSHLRSSRRRRFLKGIQDSLHTPYSNGFSKQQIQYLNDACKANQQIPLIVMAHTPLLNPYASFDESNEQVQEIVLPLKVDERFSEYDDDDRCIRFEEETATAKLDNGTIFQNSLPFLRAVQSYEHQVIVLSGHNHEQVELGLEKQNGQFYQSEYSRRTNLRSILSSRALLMQTPALGHLKMEPTETGFPAYRTIMADNRSIASLNVQHLGRGVSDFWFYDWDLTEDGSRDMLTLTFRSSRERQEVHQECIHKIVIWPRPRRRFNFRYKPFQIVIPDYCAEAVLRLVDHQRPPQGGDIVLLCRHVSRLDIQLAHRPVGIPLAFLFETFENRDGQYVSLGLKRHHRDLKPL